MATEKTTTTGVAPVVNPLLTQHATANKFWGKEVEDLLPIPQVTEDPSLVLPSMYLEDICRYARGFKSRGEELFRIKYLVPLFNHFKKVNQVATDWGEDLAGNYFVTVGEHGGIMHVAHYDSVHAPEISPYQEVLVEKNILKLAPVKKNSVGSVKKGTRWVNDVDVGFHYVDYALPATMSRSLGADDGVGVAIMLYLIANQKPGTYVFTRAEEVGCLGSDYIVANKSIILEDYQVAIQVDRKGKEEILCKMGVGKTASQSFGASLSAALGMKHHTNGRGSVTDIAKFCLAIPECVNVAAGYYNQHGATETCHIDYVDQLGVAMVGVDYSTLVIERTPGDTNEFGGKVGKSRGGFSDGFDYEYGNRKSNYAPSYVSKTNSFKDYTSEPGLNTESLADLESWQQVQFIRSNVNFVAQFIEALGVSPAQMENLIYFGKINPTPEEIADFLGHDDDTGA